jgi:hypothetical protein
MNWECAQMFKRWYLAGTAKDKTPGGRDYNVFVEIEWTGDRLSITGVEGPKANGDCYGGSGQIGGNGCGCSLVDRVETPRDAEQLVKLDEIWSRWHLNDMNPCCEHQRAAGWLEMAREARTIYHWHLKQDVSLRQHVIETSAKQALRRGEAVQYSAEEFALISLKGEVSTLAPELPDDLAEHYGGSRYDWQKSSETKTRGEMRPSEHPDGLLCAPCPECGYKYGTAWIKEEVPADVVAWLEALPDASALVPTRWLR